MNRRRPTHSLETLEHGVLFGSPRYLKAIFGIVLVVSLVAFLIALLPLGKAVQFGGDEGYNLSLGVLKWRGFALYRSIWYDQPPVFIVVLASAFRICGPSILVARLIGAAFGMLMFTAFYEVVRLRANPAAAIAAAFFLVASPGVLQLSVCVMQEVPTFATVLLSVVFLLLWAVRRRWRWLAGSAATMGLALGIKLTAALVVPAIMAEILLVCRTDKNAAWRKRFVISTLLWTCVTVITFVGIILLWGRGSLDSIFRAHFGTQTGFIAERPQDFPIQPGIFLSHAECVIAAAAGIILAIKRRRLREFAIPGVWLATVLAVHTIHRPWWTYYYLHFAIPMTWFAGFAVSEAAKPFFELFGKRSLNFSARKTRQVLALCILAALALVISERRLEAEVTELRARTRIDADPLLVKIREYAPQTHWIYVRYTKEAYAFHAGLLMPPELAVVSLKRFWSNQISTQEIVDTCKKYKPEQIMLNDSDVTPEWRDLLRDYSIVYRGMDSLLFVRTSLLPVPLSK